MADHLLHHDPLPPARVPRPGRAGRAGMAALSAPGLQVADRRRRGPLERAGQARVRSSGPSMAGAASRRHRSSPVRATPRRRSIASTCPITWATRSPPRGREAGRQASPNTAPRKTFDRPDLTDDGPAVHFLWPLADPNSEFDKHKEVLFAAARSITHLGWGVDMVAANAAVIARQEADKLPGERWWPAHDGSGKGLRVPVEGTLRASHRQA